MIYYIDMSFFISPKNKIKKYIKKMRDECDKKSVELTCNIKDDGIKNISYFLSHIIPLTNKDIKLKDIKKGKILQKGSFGYTFATSDKIIKIIVCHNSDIEMVKSDIKFYKHKIINLNEKIEYEEKLMESPLSDKIKSKENIIHYESQIEQFYKIYNDLQYILNFNDKIKNEIEIYKKITILDSETNIVMKLLGYYEIINNKYIYKYFRDKNFIESNTTIDLKPLTDLGKLVNPCESYLITEKGDMDLFTYFFEKDNSEFELDNFIKLFDIYKFNTLNTSNISNFFVHNDIKLENIVMHNETYKYIDFGISKFQDNFFEKNVFNSSVTKYHRLLFGSNNIYISPLYDIFCIIVMILDLYLYNNNKEFTSIEQLLTYKDHNIRISRLLNFLSHIYYFHSSNSELDIQNFKYDNIIYINSGNKKNDDRIYFNKIMETFLEKLI